MWTLMLLPVIVAVVVLMTRPGGIRALQSVRLRWLPLIWVAAAVQLVRTWHPTWAAPLPVVLMWLLGIAFVAANLRGRPGPVRLGLGGFALGFTLNSLTIVANGRMPLSPWAARIAGFSERTVAASAGAWARTTFRIFADVIPVPPLQTVVSVGDLLMFTGITVVIVALARHRTPDGVGTAAKGGA